MNQRIPWRRVLVEGVVIVGSILLAFGIDAAWEGRQERERTDRQFQALVREFRQIQSEISRELQVLDRAREGTAAVLEVMREGAAPVSPEELAARGWRSMNAGIFTAQHPVMTMTMTSGELIEYEDEGLVSLLSQWRVRLDDLRLDSQHLERNREEMIFNRMVALGVPLELERPSPALLPMVRDPGMEAAFVLRELRIGLLAESYASALESADEIVSVLEGILSN